MRKAEFHQLYALVNITHNQTSESLLEAKAEYDASRAALEIQTVELDKATTELRAQGRE